MTSPTPASGSYFERIDENRYKPTAHAGGAWDPAEMHFSPLGGLVVHAVERFLAAREGGDAGLVLSRISYDILGRLALDECEIRVEAVRPGRTIELLEAVVSIAGRPAVRARAWLLAPWDTAAVAGGGDERLPSPDDLGPSPLTTVWPGGYVSSLDVRPLRPPLPGRATVWVASPLALVAGEAVSPLASFVALVDTANGVATRQPPTVWMYPNVDLTVHLHRQPEGGWVGLDTTVVFGPTGQGITSSVLHDLAGPVGHAQQMLTVRPLPGA
ncbi:thioesterase family protein [Streptomyces sp. 4N509B]|uniref:thioesterase family protein n=1 Tax=Streptomyces sp. 4N509B TaxID=3457413 RepID=UPI003FD1EAFE